MPIGPWELAIVAVIVVIIFGVGKLPQIGGALGQSIRDFKSNVTTDDEQQSTTTTTTTSS